MKMKYGHKGASGAYKGAGKMKIKAKSPLRGKRMARGPKEVSPSHKGYVAS